MNIQYYKLRLLGQPFRCGGGGGGGGGGDGGGDGAAVGGGDGAAVGGGDGAAGDGGPGDGPGDSGVSTIGFDDGSSISIDSSGNVVGVTEATDTASSSGPSSEASANAQAAAEAQAAANAQAAAEAQAAAHEASAIGQAQNAISNQSLSQDQATQAAMSLSAITGMNPMDSLMAVTDGFGTAPGLSSQGPSHSSGVSFADIAVAHALGLGNQDVNSGQTVNQAIAAAAVHSGLNNNIGQVMGALGGPVVGMIATAANAVAQGHSFSSVVGQIAASIVGTAISNATGLAVNANTVNAIANGQIGQAAMGLAIGQVAQSTGLSIGTVTAAMSGNLGAAVANTVMGQVVGAAAQAMSVGPLGGMAIGAIANQSGMPTNIANSINQSAIGQAVNSATSAINSSISSAGIGVPGGPSGVASAVSAASSGADGSAPSLGDVLTSAVNSGALEKAVVLQPQAPGAPAAPAGPSKSDKYWQNLYSDLGMSFSQPPAQKANNTANEMYANQAKAQALMDAEKEYTDIFGRITPDVAAAISSAPDPVKYVDGLYTTDAEAREIWRKTVGTNPTEFDLMEIIGLDEGQAGSIADNRANTTAEEATAFFRDLYGKDFTPTEEQLQSVMGPRPEAAAKSDIQNIYTKDKNTTNNTEAEAFWKEMGNTGPIPAETLFQMLSMPESGAKALSEDLGNTTAEEATAFLRQFYGSSYQPTEEQLATLVGKRPEASAWEDVKNIYTEDKNITTFDEAQSIWERMGNTRPMTTDELAAIAGGTERSAEVFSQHAQVLEMTVYNGRDFATPQEAAEAAKKAGMTEFFGPDGLIYKIQTPVEEGAAKDKIKNLPTFNEAFAAAMRDIGAGKTFEWTNPKTGETKTFTTTYAATNKIIPFDGSKSATKEDAAKLAVANGKLSFTHDGKTYGLDMQTASIIAKSQNQSEAETNRLLRQAIKPATDESMAETQRLISSGTRGTMDTVSTVLANTFGTTAEGLGQLVQSFGDAYSLASGETLGNSIYKAGKVLEAYGKEQQVYGANVQTERMEQVRKIADNASTEFERIQILAEGAIKYPLGFWGDVGKEFGQEAPTVLTGLATGAALFLGAPVVGTLKVASLASAFFETVEVFGAEGASVERARLAKGDSPQAARGAALLQGTFAAAITFPTQFIADKVLMGSWFGGLSNATIGSVISGGTRTISSQMAAEMMQTFPTTLSSQYLVNGEVNVNSALTATYYSAMVSAGTTGAMITPTTIRDSAVIAKDYNGGNVTWGEFISGSKITDLKTLDLSVQIGTSSDGNPVTMGTLTAAPVDGVPSYEFLKNVLPASITNQNYIVGTDALGDPVTLDMLTSEVKSETGYDTVFKNLLDATPQQKEEAQYDFLESILKDFGYKPTEQEIRTLITDNPTGSADLQAKAEQYTDPRMVTEQEAKDAYAALGLNKPTQADILKLVGQYDETGLTGKATENLDSAKYNSIIEQIEQLGTQAGVDPAVLDAIKNDINSQITALGGDVSKLQSGVDSVVSEQAKTQAQITDLQNNLSEEIQAAKDIGLEGDAALKAGLNSLSEKMGVDQAALLTQLGTTEETLRTEFSSGITGLETQMKEQYDALTTEQKALADALTAQGTTLADAIAAAQESTATQISDLEAATNAQYEALTVEQKALADALTAQGTTLTDAIAAAQEQTAGQIGELTADVQAKYDALTAEQKVIATNLEKQGVDLNEAIETAKAETQQQITDLGVEVDARINELMQQGQTYQQATQQAFAEVNAKNQEMAGLIGTQGRTANQSDIDALTEMLGGQRSMDLAYDVTGDKQITQADIDFLTQVVGGVKTDWTAPQQSPWAATGLYGQIQANELQRQQDLQDQLAREQAAAVEADRQAQISGVRSTLSKNQQTLQQAAQQLPQAYRQAQETTAPIYGQMGPYLDLGSPLDVDFFKPSPEKQAGTKQQQPTKIAAGGYIDDLLAGDMSVDELLNLLR